MYMYREIDRTKLAKFGHGLAIISTYQNTRLSGSRGSIRVNDSKELLQCILPERRSKSNPKLIGDIKTWEESGFVVWSNTKHNGFSIYLHQQLIINLIVPYQLLAPSGCSNDWSVFCDFSLTIKQYLDILPGNEERWWIKNGEVWKWGTVSIQQWGYQWEVKELQFEPN